MAWTAARATTNVAAPDLRLSGSNNADIARSTSPSNVHPIQRFNMDEISITETVDVIVKLEKTDGHCPMSRIGSCFAAVSNREYLDSPR